MTDRVSWSLPIVETDEPLRSVKLAEVRGVRSPRLHPIGRYHRRPYEHRAPARARCHRHDHAAPALDCTCGFHAVASAVDLPDVAEVYADCVLLDVELGGTVIEHERGYRAELQSILGVGFPCTCSWCGQVASLVVPGRLWRSTCPACAGARSRTRALGRADATALLGIDVHFADVPGETRRRRMVGVARAVGMWVLMLVCVVEAFRSAVNVVAAAGVCMVAVCSFGLCLVTARSRSSRHHGDWFVAQCACVVVGSVLLTIGAR